ncbi:hypothetical protein BKA69DRAFT_1038663 [Paraphysoderma sedebokerense]|nr:hypothetical protein BKA69DRAFT_1038663 [Paraphysoderma sedebokerense]
MEYSPETLPQEILLKVFAYLRPPTHSASVIPQRKLTSHPATNSSVNHYYKEIRSCLYVCKNWYIAAAYLIHSQPVFHQIYDFTRWLKSVEFVANTLSEQEDRRRAKIVGRRDSGTELDNCLNLEWKGKGRVESSEGETKGDAEMYEFGDNLTHRIGILGPTFTRHLCFCIRPNDGLSIRNEEEQVEDVARFIEDSHIHRLAAAFEVIKPQITSLSLKGCSQLTDTSVIYLLAAIGFSLRQIDLTACRLLGNLTVRSLVVLSNDLTNIRLRGCSKIGHSGIIDLSELAAQLRELDIGGYLQLTDFSLLHLTSQMTTRSLKKLCLPTEMMRSVSHRVLFKCISDIAKSHPNLAHLEFSIPSPTPRSTYPNPTCFQLPFFPHLTNLTTLVIRQCQYIDSTTYLDISNSCLNLTNLQLFNPTELTCTAFSKLLSSCRKLRILSIQNAKRLSQSDIIISFDQNPDFTSTIEVLDFSNNPQLTNTFILHLLQCQQPILPLSYTSYQSRPVQPTSEFIPLLPSLRSLSLENNRYINVSSILPFIKIYTSHSDSQNFEFLNVSGCGSGVTSVNTLLQRPLRTGQVRNELETNNDNIPGTETGTALETITQITRDTIRQRLQSFRQPRKTICLAKLVNFTYPSSVSSKFIETTYPIEEMVNYKRDYPYWNPGFEKWDVRMNRRIMEWVVDEYKGYI